MAGSFTVASAKAGSDEVHSVSVKVAGLGGGNFFMVPLYARADKEQLRTSPEVVR